MLGSVANRRLFEPRSLRDALRMLDAEGPLVPMAGCTDLYVALNFGTLDGTKFLNLWELDELRRIAVRGDVLSIGALCTYTAIIKSRVVQTRVPMLTAASRQIGGVQIQNRGTIGGNIAHADPASDLPTVLVALDARVTAIGPKGTRTIPAEDFFTGIMSTALAEDEVVSEIVVTASARGQGSAYVKFAHPASRYAVIGAAALVTMEKDQCRGARIAVGGLLPHATRAKAVETALVGKPGTATAIEAAAARLQTDLGDQVSGDLYASAEYRSAVAPVYVKRAVAAAAARAGLA